MNTRDQHTDTSLINVSAEYDWKGGHCFFRCGKAAVVRLGYEGKVYCADHYVAPFIGRLMIAIDRSRFGQQVVA